MLFFLPQQFVRLRGLPFLTGYRKNVWLRTGVTSSGPPACKFGFAQVRKSLEGSTQHDDAYMVACCGGRSFPRTGVQLEPQAEGPDSGRSRTG
jgi:hypothetical protein